MDILTRLMMPRPAIHARMVESEVVSPRKFLAMTAQEREDIVSVRVEPPVLGKPGFGGFRIHWKSRKPWA